ncbi:imm11 family protein [Flavivirga algicola]|uniref:Ankyrin repeat domain-containing protein n=1 Tax=Flavivirga algicola TaxID=2729136 RepID=A0ABX1RZI6_9FLAO|nr:DUF1629 domain-containing protein [Flavivirga algicola]NMH89009.1 ankyrin repeat domain-containing protein [Flavivirga algicola]
MNKTDQSNISEELETKYEIELPERLKQFYDTLEYKKYEGLNTYDIPTHYDNENKKHLVKFNNKSFFDKFYTIGKKIKAEDWEGMFPLCPLPKDQFLTVKDQMPEYPVYVRSDGEFKLYRESFDEFIEKLLPKGEKTPILILISKFKKVDQLFSEEKYQEIINLLMPITNQLRLGRHTTYTKSVVRGLNYIGVASFKLGLLDQAFAYYEKCKKCSVNAIFSINMLDICIQQKDFNKAVEVALCALKEDYLLPNQAFRVREFLGKSYIGLNDPDRAKAIYQKILDEWLIADTNKIIKVREDLMKYINEQGSNKTIVEQILAWFKPKNHEISNGEEAYKEWWDNLDSFGLFWKKYFRKAIAIPKGQEPTMRDLSKMFEIEELELGFDDLVTDLSLFKKFTKLKRFCFFGKVNTLSHLQGCAQLDYLRYNGRIIKNLQLPFDSSALFEACVQGKVDVLLKALKSGVSAKIKDDEDHNSLLITALKNKHLDMALRLITYGADPWAQNLFDNDAFYYCYGEDIEKMKEQIMQATKKAGLVNKQTVFKRVKKDWKLSHPDFLNQKIARFDGLTNVDIAYRDFIEGISLLSTFPKDAYYMMRKPKKYNKLADCFMDTFHMVVSEKVKDFLDSKKLKFVEYLPVNILNHNEDQCAIYYIVNITKLHDCIDYEKSEPEYSPINPDEIREVKQLVIDESRLDKEIQMFRCKRFPYELLWRTEFAEEFLAQGFSGVVFNDLKR